MGGSRHGSSGKPGRIRVEMRFRSLIAAEALLAFGTDAEVLAPFELRHNLARKSADTAALYAERLGCDHGASAPGTGLPVYRYRETSHGKALP